jgi:catechol 2,3-dioxygenase
MLDLLVGDRNAREMRNATDGGGIDGHRNVPAAGQVRRVPREPMAGRLYHARRIAQIPGRADITAMDAPNPSATPTFASRAPLHIGAVGLKVRDLARLTDFYRAALGLSVLDRGKDEATLGVGGVPLVQLEHRPDAPPDDPRTAGLYHTAFLMPTRPDLARWILHVARHKVPLTGASDHAVSEAFYLDDPEGNGIEVYCDRPPDTWQWTGSDLKITTDPLDIEDIVREVAPAAVYPGAPDGLRIGHVHLRVGDVARAEAFYRDALGLDVTRHGATFLSSGRYHHHIAGNVWHSAGAGRRDDNRAGLSWLALEAADAAAFDAVTARLSAAGAPLAAIAEGVETTDPWKTRLRITRA